MSARHIQSGEAQALVIVSIGLYWSWIQLVFFSQAFTGASLHPDVSFATNIVAHLLGLALLFGFAKKLSPLARRRWLILAAALLVSLACLGLFISNHNLGLTFDIICNILVGGLSAVFMAVWGEALSAIKDFNYRKTTLCVAVLVAFALFILVSNLPTPLLVAFVVTAPLFCVFASHVAYLALESEAATTDEKNESKALQETLSPFKPTRGTFAKLIVCAFLFAIPMSYFKSGGPASYLITSQTITLFALSLVFLVDYLLRRRGGVGMLPHAFVLTISGGLLLLPFLTQESPLVTSILITTGGFSFRAYVYPLCGDMVKQRGTLPIKAFAIAEFAVDLGQLAGVGLRNTLSLLPETWFLNVTLGLVYLIFLAGSLLFTSNLGQKRPALSLATPQEITYSLDALEDSAEAGKSQNGDKQRAGRGKLKAKQPAPSSGDPIGDIASAEDDASAGAPESGNGELATQEAEPEHADYATNVISGIESQCALLAERFGLTSRETEIAALIARGRTIQSVADEMCISQNTAKTHASHVYQKCQVHSREELVMLLEQLVQ